MLKPCSFFPCYWCKRLLLSNYVEGTQGIQRAENMSGTIYKRWLFLYPLAWTPENIERGKKYPLKIPALLSISLPVFVLSVLAIYKPKPEIWTWLPKNFFFPISCFQWEFRNESFSKSFDLSLETSFLLPSSHSKTCIFFLFLLTEPSQELKDSSQNYTSQDWIIF